MQTSDCVKTGDSCMVDCDVIDEFKAKISPTVEKLSSSIVTGNDLSLVQTLSEFVVNWLLTTELAILHNLLEIFT